jgi:hypothetical protein
MKRPRIYSNVSNARGAVTRQIESAGSLPDRAEGVQKLLSGLPVD